MDVKTQVITFSSIPILKGGGEESTVRQALQMLRIYVNYVTNGGT
jgi:hypothetical protein